MPEGATVEPAAAGADDPLHPNEPVTDAARLRQRAVFLRELAEARALLARKHLVTWPAARWGQARQALKRNAPRG